MYFVKYGDNYLHDPRVDKYILHDLSFSGKSNSCGYCDFTIYPDHPMNSKLKERDENNPIEVYDDEDLIFSGVIYELGVEFYLDGHVKCKGELSYLSDSIVRPYSTLDSRFREKVPSTINGYFEWLITQHNNQVGVKKQFTIGRVQGTALDPDNHIVEESDEYPTTFDEITNKLLNVFGGYLQIRRQNGIRYIDYLSEYTDTNSQILDFGKNLTNYTQTDDSEKITTFIIPLGSAMSSTNYSYNNGYYVTSDYTVNPNKTYYTFSDKSYSKCSSLTSFVSGTTYYEYYEEDDESKSLLTIKSISDENFGTSDYAKRGDMVYCKSAVHKYGWIGGQYKNNDITDVYELLEKGTIALMELISPKRTIEIKAVDMHLINPEIKSIKIGEYVRVRSKPHKLDSYFLCVNIELNLNNPDDSLYTLGTTFDTLTGQQNEQINKLNATINTQYEVAKAISEEAKATAKDAITSATQAADSLNEVKSNIVYNVTIFSTNGNIFKNSVISSILSAKVYHGSTDITDTLPETLFRWTRVSNDISADSLWNSSHGLSTKQIAITQDDVYERATFNCEVTIE